MPSGIPWPPARRIPTPRSRSFFAIRSATGPWKARISLKPFASLCGSQSVKPALPAATGPNSTTVFGRAFGFDPIAMMRRAKARASSGVPPVT